MFRFLARRKAAITVAEEVAADLILSVGPVAAMSSVRRDLRWLEPSESDRERKLTFVLRAIEKRIHYHQPAGAATTRFLDTII